MSEAPGADTLELERELRAKLPPPDASWLVRKRGYFYRGESSGYTGAKSQAGRYTEAEAKDIASIEPDCMSALRASEWPDDPMTLSPEVLRRLLDALASLRAEKEELRRERDAKDALWRETAEQAATNFDAWLEDIARAEAAESLLAEAGGIIGRALEELRLIRMKDSGAVYDTTLRLEASAVATRIASLTKE